MIVSCSRPPHTGNRPSPLGLADAARARSGAEQPQRGRCGLHPKQPPEGVATKGRTGSGFRQEGYCKESDRRSIATMTLGPTGPRESILPGPTKTGLPLQTTLVSRVSIGNQPARVANDDAELTDFALFCRGNCHCGPRHPFLDSARDDVSECRRRRIRETANSLLSLRPLPPRPPRDRIEGFGRRRPGWAHLSIQSIIQTANKSTPRGMHVLLEHIAQRWTGFLRKGQRAPQSLESSANREAERTLSPPHCTIILSSSQ